MPYRRHGRLRPGSAGSGANDETGLSRCNNGQMTIPSPAAELFKGRHFDQQIIVLCVRWYLSFKLSSRDLVQMMTERGIVVAHTTILRWGATLCSRVRKALEPLRSTG